MVANGMRTKIYQRNHKGEWCINNLSKFCQEGYCSQCNLSKKILVDIDGCICAYNFESMVWNRFHVEIDPTRIFAYNLADVLGVSSDDIDDMFRSQVWGMPFFNPGAIQVLAEWKAEYQILIYSNRIKYMGRKGLAAWLIEWKVPFTDIDNGKGQYDFHIDDRPEKLCDTDSKVRLLYTQPWNESCLNIKKQITRVHSWFEIQKIVG